MSSAEFNVEHARLPTFTRGPRSPREDPISRGQTVMQHFQTQTPLSTAHQSRPDVQQNMFPKSFLSSRTVCYCGFKMTASPTVHSTLMDLRASLRGERGVRGAMWFKFTPTGEKYRRDGEGRTDNHMDTRLWLQKGQERFTGGGFHYPLTYKKQAECPLMTEAPQFYYISSPCGCCHCLLLLSVGQYDSHLMWFVNLHIKLSASLYLIPIRTRTFNKYTVGTCA